MSEGDLDAVTAAAASPPAAALRGDRVEFLPERPDAPYPGLRPFEPHEADIFFGRESHVDALIARLQSTHFLAVFGPSGCGKSSLVRAGLVPGLELGLMAPEGADWRIAIMRPADRPYSALAEELTDPSVFGRRGDGKLDVFLLEAELRRGPLGLVHARQAAGLSPETNLLLVVDQFEEIFRFRREHSVDDSDKFVDLLLRSAREHDARIFVVITLRSDFIGHCAVFQGLPEAINDSQYLTPRLTREQCEAAIAGPARVFGGSVDPALLNTLLNEFGTDPDQLPVLQHSLMRMWTEAHRAQPGQPVVLTMDDYKALGSMSGALSAHANERYDAAEQRGLARVTEIMFKRLSERTDDGREVRAPATVEEIADIADASPADVIAVADIYRAPDCCFLMPPASQELATETKLDISHESLIRQWDRLAAPETGWLQRESAMAQFFRYASRRAASWKRVKEARGNPPHLTDDDLAAAKDWLSHEGLRARWAQRYVPPGIDYGERHADVVALIEASIENERREVEEKEAHARREAEHQRQRLEDAERVALERQQRLEERERNTRRLKMTIAALMLVSVGTVALAIYAFIQADRAEESERTAQIAQLASEARGFWDALEFTSRDVTQPESNNLLRLAKASPTVRRRFIELGLTEPAWARRLAKRPVEVVDAAAGVGLETRAWMRKTVLAAQPGGAGDEIKIARALALLALEDPESLRDGIEVKKRPKPGTGGVGAGLAGSLSAAPSDTARVATVLFDALKVSKDSDQITALGAALAALAPTVPELQLVGLVDGIIAALGVLEDSRQLSALAPVLRAAAPKLPSSDLTRMIDVLIAAIPQRDHARQTPAKGTALAALAPQLPPDQLSKTADTLVGQITSELPSRQVAAFGTGFASVVAKLADADAVKSANALIAALHGNSESPRLGPVGSALLAVAPRVPSASASSVAESLLAALSTSERISMPSLRGAFEALLRSVPDAEVPAMAEALTKAIAAKKYRTEASTEARGLAALAPKLPDSALPNAASALIAVAHFAQSGNDLTALGAGIAAIAPNLPEAAVARVTDALLGAMRADDFSSAALAPALAILAERHPRAEQGASAQALIAAIRVTRDPDAVSALGRALANSVARVSEAHLRRTIDAMITALGATVDVDQSRALGTALAAAVSRLPQPQVARVVENVSGTLRVRRVADGVPTISAALPPLIKALSDADAARLASGVISAMRSTRETALIAEFARMLPDIEPRISQADAVAASYALFSGMKATVNRGQLTNFRNAFVSLARRLPPTEATRLSELLVSALRQYTDTDQLDAFGRALGALIPMLTETQLARVAEALLSNIRGATDRDQLRNMRMALEGALKALPENARSSVQQAIAEAAKAAKGVQAETLTGLVPPAGDKPATQPRTPTTGALIALLEASKEPDASTRLSERAREITAKLSEAEATQVADELARAIAGGGAARNPAALRPVLQPLLEKVSDRLRFAFTIIDAILVSENAPRLQALTAALGAAAAATPDEQRPLLVTRLRDRLANADDAREVGALTSGLVAVLSNTEPVAPYLVMISQVMKYPGPARTQLADLVRDKIPAAPRRDRGFTAFLAWLSETTRTDFESPPK